MHHLPEVFFIDDSTDGSHEHENGQRDQYISTECRQLFQSAYQLPTGQVVRFRFAWANKFGGHYIALLKTENWMRLQLLGKGLGRCVQLQHGIE